jgi:nucleolar protein 56
MPEKIADLRKKLIAEAKVKVSKAYSSKDLHVIKAVKVVEELDGVFNLLAEHAVEWYGFHFPELYALVNDNDLFLKVVLAGQRKDLNAKKLDFLSEELRAQVLSAAKKTMGAEISLADLKQVQKLAENAFTLKEQRKELTAYLEKAMKELAPNFTEVCGPVIGAKLLAQAGSLERLASLPSSTLQLLGAEKALFRHLRSGGKPPKHGFIYAHPLVKTLKTSLKGKMARTLAAKLSIAAREDFYGEKDISAGLKKSLDARAAELRK